jgi:hypothetical protein
VIVLPSPYRAWNQLKAAGSCAGSKLTTIRYDQGGMIVPRGKVNWTAPLKRQALVRLTVSYNATG